MGTCTLTHTENEEHDHARHVHIAKTQTPCPGTKNRVMVTSSEDWLLGLFMKGLLETGSLEGQIGGGQGECPRGAGKEDLRQEGRNT